MSTIKYGRIRDSLFISYRELGCPNVYGKHSSILFVSLFYIFLLLNCSMPDAFTCSLSTDPLQWDIHLKFRLQPDQALYCVPFYHLTKCQLKITSSL